MTLANTMCVQIYLQLQPTFMYCVTYAAVILFGCRHCWSSLLY